ncbi:hypothetical protein DS885_14750 [Psychromonas sp. B3M02]|uniref:hypothetical protein n=1 Tax=Psychromonas sp. B3M02 TaxID=2267226 RepID=UPI000DE86625|nr:hypothetical protein [Psychromonas sp. B3M02]RBW42780.1 hypothetical protein DS885_14750 [Psychromonas sp. B3M02]
MSEIPDISKGEGVVRAYELFEELQADVLKAYEVLDKEKESQFLRRAVVRSVFALVEAIAEIIKVEIRSTLRLEGGKESLSGKELNVLGGLSITPNSKEQKFLPIEENLKLTFKIASKLWGLDDFQFDASGENYRDFLRAKGSRNKLTHPRTFYDIQITDDDMHCHTVTFQWSCNEFKRIFKHRITKLTPSLSTQDTEVINNYK